MEISFYESMRRAVRWATSLSTETETETETEDSDSGSCASTP